MSATTLAATPTVEIKSIAKRTGIAGQVLYVATVGYQGEPESSVGFYGNVFGGPVVMDAGSGQVFVTEPSRFGAFGPEWVRRFFS